MELSREQIKITKGVAILFMILLHLFCTKVYEGIFTPIIFIGEVPLVYYFALFGDCCVTIYCFCSGYGLFKSYKNNKESYQKNNKKRALNLYINYWIVIFLFVILLGLILGQTDMFSGDIKILILTIMGIETYYNGAWWFFTIYMILLIVSPIIHRIVIKYNPYIIVVISFLLYTIAYIQRIKVVIDVDNGVIMWIVRNLALFGTSQLPFIIGVIFAKDELYSKLNKVSSKIKYKNIIGVLLIILMIIAHGIVQTLFVAIFTGIGFICIFNLIDKPIWLNKVLSYLGDHSTNLWLTHMFIYITYLKEIVFAPRYSFLIFPWLIIICLMVSYLIKSIENIIKGILLYKI